MCDVRAVIRALPAPHGDAIRKIFNPAEIAFETDADGGIASALLPGQDGRPITLRAARFVFAAGRGNEALLAARPGWTAEDAMSAVLMVHADERIDAVADLMAREQAECVVVTDGDVRPLGIVCARQLARRLLHRAA